MSSPSWDSADTIEWLLTDGRFLPTLADMTQALGDRLHAEGVPLQRIRLSMRMLHPLMVAYSAIWSRGQTEPETTQAPHGLEQRSSYIGSPMAEIRDTGKPFRKRLTETLDENDHHVLHEFKEAGSTDYFGIPLHFQAGLGGSLTVLTDIEGGFSDHDLEHLSRIATVLAPITELANSQQTAHAITDTYLGARSGSRVLNGEITRGDIDTVQAAMMICDIRNWTRVSNDLSPKQSLTIVNAFFDLVAEAVDTHGGEILKFVGDGVLAIFPVVDGNQSAEKASTNALFAARQTFEQSARNTDLAELNFGIGLHFGDVLYGNVGSQTRLDFTVLGPTVNMTSRIEGLCSRLNEPLLYSREFANLIQQRSRLVSRSELKGFDGEFDVMTQASMPENSTKL